MAVILFLGGNNLSWVTGALAIPSLRGSRMARTAVTYGGGWEGYDGTERHPCELHLYFSGTEHRRTGVRTHMTKGFVPCFNGTDLEEVSAPAFR